MATTLANISIKDNSAWNTYLNLIYPVGSVYFSYTSTSPATRFGGSWSAITGSFIYANAGTSKNTTKTHYHWMPLGKENGLPALSATAIAGWSNGATYQLRAAPNVAHSTFVEDAYFGPEDSGANATETTTYATEGYPPYQTLYCWRRTA